MVGFFFNSSFDDMAHLNYLYHKFINVCVCVYIYTHTDKFMIQINKYIYIYLTCREEQYHLTSATRRKLKSRGTSM